MQGTQKHMSRMRSCWRGMRSMLRGGVGMIRREGRINERGTRRDIDTMFYSNLSITSYPLVIVFDSFLPSDVSCDNHCMQSMI